MEQTLSIIKPDVTRTNKTGAVNQLIESKGFRIVAQKRIMLTKANAQVFYIQHKEQPFYNDLVTYMTSGSVVVQVLQKDNAISHYRTLMGSTDPSKAGEGTIRALFGTSIESNAVHGSDSPEAATREISFFFSKIEIVG